MKQLLIILCLFFSLLNYAQNTNSKFAIFNLSEVAMLDLQPNNNTSVVLNLNAPNEAGESAIITSSNNKNWINFTSAVEIGKSRNISIKIESGTVPSGVHLKVVTSTYLGNGKGVLGNPTSGLILNKTSQTLISNIGGAFTGMGKNNGYELNYTLEIYDYKLLDFDNSDTLTISLTLTDF